ncbi:MAG: bifunctional 5,10-methylenetetrahydrofolate dehydrogenase/5,10-methenyltetrahydrofolate cyclohydrolase, partial [Candidatus Omnitrophica bacterium]|nr:bifunctional 5,10-methylenetetrahydrofolate dehydrogenase/5,10-methenyltetrahydrofolate cyclohydrolase [Candidatus Omnitrophota bacterium]
MGNLIDGKIISEKIKEEVKKEIEFLRSKGIVPKLVSISVGENPASSVYINQQKKNCEKIGIDYEVLNLPENLTEDEICENIEKLNRNENITGIILQLPLPKGIDTRKVQSKISYLKDVEGVNPSNMGW